MQIQMPFDVAEVLKDTTLKVDYPEVWSRYLNSHTVRVSSRLYATVQTAVGRLDLILIMEYLRAWLKAQDEIPDENLTSSQKRLYGSVSSVVLRLVAAIEAASRPQHAEACAVC